MSEYGLTSNGPNIKRLDTILDEMHTKLTDAWGVNTRQNPSSFLNTLLTDFGDKVAELWEFGEEIYYSQYPSTAEGTSLDNVAAYGGSTREAAEKSHYPIHCTGKDGTTLAVGTLISSDTNPSTQLSLTAEGQITRSSFNKAVIKVVIPQSDSTYTVAINSTVFSFASTTNVSSDIIKGVAGVIKSDEFTTTLDEENGTLLIEAVDITSSNTLVLSENLTTETVTSIVTFSTVDTGDILIPEGAITNIVKADAGLESVTNLCSYVAGRDKETDTELRQSYADKIYNRSSRMLDSIRSAILENVQGVESCSTYENCTDKTDTYGRPPHSIEVVVDGGDKTEIAEQILSKKAGGIATYRSDGDNGVTVALKGLYGEEIDINFNRSEKVYIWFHVGITMNPDVYLPTNYAELIKDTILDCMDDTEAGEDIVPQTFLSKLYANVAGVTYFDITLFSTKSSGTSPSSYTERSVSISQRERAVTSESCIEVVIDG